MWKSCGLCIWKKGKRSEKRVVDLELKRLKDSYKKCEKIVNWVIGEED